jgi:hypothetical protein
VKARQPSVSGAAAAFIILIIAIKGIPPSVSADVGAAVGVAVGVCRSDEVSAQKK